MTSANNPRPPGPPRYLDFRQATILREAVDRHILAMRRELLGEGADPGALDHEIGLALARAACRLNLDLLRGADQTIERLEAVVAELGARLEGAKMAQAIEGEGTPAPDRLADAAAAFAEAGDLPNVPKPRRKL